MTDSDLQISEVIALNSIFSSKINVRDFVLKEIPFVYIKEFDDRKTGKKYLVSITFHRIVQRLRKGCC